MKYDVKTLNNEGRHDKMTSFIGYINNNVIKLRYILIRTCVLTSKL